MSKNHLPGSIPTPANRQALVAAAKVLTGRRIDRTDFNQRPWQDEAWAHYDAIGELRYAARYEANAISRARLVAARLSDQPGQDPEVLPDNHPAQQIMHQFMGGQEKQSAGLERLAMQLYISGLSYLVAYDEGRGEDKIQRWHVLSAEEIRAEDDTVTLMLTDSPSLSGDGTLTLKRSDVLIVRVWTPHPRRWYEPDSAVRGVLPILRELDGLTKHVSATIDSRLAGAGILVIPQEMVFTSNRDDLADDQDPFVVELIEAMMDPIKNRDTAAAVVPLVIKVPGQFADSIQHIRFGTDFDTQTRDLREETIRRLALGLDIPPEILLGVGDVNHWTAWQIEESSVKLHIEPKLNTICAGITEAFLRPALESEGEDADDIICWYDTTPLKLRPNRGEDAQNLHDKMLITDESRRMASGFGDKDAPNPEDKFLMVLENVLVNSPQMSLEFLPIYAKLLGANIEGLDELIESIRARTGVDGEPDDVSNGADPTEADDDPTPAGQTDDSPASMTVDELEAFLNAG